MHGVAGYQAQKTHLGIVGVLKFINEDILVLLF